MARSPMVRIPGEAPKLDEPEARDAPDNSVGDVAPTPSVTETRAASSGAGLPDASEIDVRTITKTVLTKQGYICPLPENDALSRPPSGNLR